MSKWFGTIGYAITSETRPGIWEESIVKKQVYGDINRISRNYQTTEHKNDDITINNELSIVADPFAMQNFQYIRYIDWMGTKFKASVSSINLPRITLSIGGVYNGPTGPSSGTP